MLLQRSFKVHILQSVSVYIIRYVFLHRHIYFRSCAVLLMGLTASSVKMRSFLVKPIDVPESCSGT